jgi:serine-type D-Ala-D-Ala carboxypeptidase/endopeptidase (penicillin-binding protein 4)
MWIPSSGFHRIFAQMQLNSPMTKRIWMLAAWLGLFACGLKAQVDRPAIDTKAVRAELDKIKKASGVKNGQFGFALYDVETGALLEKERAEETLLPASTMKTVTSAAALSLLGENFKFKTVLQYDGNIIDGVLKGNVIIKGGGDPTLGSDRYEWGTDMKSILTIWVLKLREKGIRKIEGDIIGDASIFEDALVPVNWVWNDIGNYYGAGACGLSFNENSYSVIFKPAAKAGLKAEFLRTEPPMPDITFVNEMRTGSASSGDNGFVYGAQYTFLRHLKGTVPAGTPEFSIKGSIPDPALFAAQCLRKALQDSLITVSGEATTVRHMGMEGKTLGTERTAVYTHQSPALKDVVYWLNKKSINLYAEHLVKMIGYTIYKEGSTVSGTKAIAEYWATKGIDITGLHLDDGSGLSRYNGITPSQLAGMLRLDVTEPWFESFFNSLPIAGDATCPGSLKGLCKGSAAANNLRAKSGYISRVRTYAGYVATRSGRRLSFAMMANNYTCSNGDMKDFLEGLMIVLGDIP